MRYVAVSDVGKVKSNNEDCLLIGNHTIQGEVTVSGDNGTLFAVFDGVGGEAYGEVASRSAAEKLVEISVSDPDALTEEAIGDTIAQINSFIVELSKNFPVKNNMATTIAGLAFDGNNAICFNVGDSRVYRYRSELLVMLSHDDKADIKNNHVLENYLGNEHFCKQDVNVNVCNDDVRKNDIFLICSDGVSDMIDDEELAELFAVDDIFEISRRLKSKILNETRGSDNFTYILIEEI